MKATHKEWSLEPMGGFYVLKITSEEEGEDRIILSVKEIESLREFLGGLGNFADFGKEEK